jgi:hypothetical protein
VRSAAVQALSEHYREDPDTLPLLRERAVKDNNSGVRSAAMGGLTILLDDLTDRIILSVDLDAVPHF